MDQRRVVVTGLGALTPVGNTAEEFWSSLKQGKSGIGPITKFDAGEKDASGQFKYVTRIAAEVRNFDETKYIDKKEARRLDPYLKYAIATSVMAVEDAALDPARIDATRFGVCIGSGIGGITTLIEGEAEAMIVPLTIAGFCSMKAMSTRNDEPEKASRPFDAGRDGFVSAEGAGIVVLESLEHAVRRDARIYADVVGYGMTGDAHHMTAPDPEGDGATRAMQLALTDAGVDPSVVGYINAHGTS